MTKTCKIRWIDSLGNPTPDDNPAIGEAWHVGYSNVWIEESNRFPICARHAILLTNPGMEHWRFKPYTVKKE